MDTRYKETGWSPFSYITLKKIIEEEIAKKIPPPLEFVDQCVASFLNKMFKTRKNNTPEEEKHTEIIVLHPFITAPSNGPSLLGDSILFA